MSAQIVIDDGTNPPAIGSTDNPNSFLSTAHTLSNFDDSGVLGWLWTLVDKPAGSSAALSGTTGSTAQLTPDLPGSYVIQLQTYTDAPRTILDDADTQIIGVRFAGVFNWLIPGGTETIQQDSAVGWKSEVNAFLTQARPNLLPEPSATTVTSGPYSSSIGELIFADPSGGAFTINAPASPSKGDRFAVKNVTTDTTAITVAGNGSNIEDPTGPSLGANATMSLALMYAEWIYTGTVWVVASAHYVTA